jgi:hypothetical protein
MSALGHKRTSRRVRVMSALPPKADMHGVPGRGASGRSRTKLGATPPLSRPPENQKSRSESLSRNKSVIGLSQSLAAMVLIERVGDGCIDAGQNQCLTVPSMARRTIGVRTAGQKQTRPIHHSCSNCSNRSPSSSAVILTKVSSTRPKRKRTSSQNSSSKPATPESCSILPSASIASLHFSC